MSGNVGDRGSGIYTENSSGTTSTIRSSTLSGNSGAHFGGGVYFDYSSQATLENSTIYGNSAEVGGGVYDYGAATANPGLTITASTITHNDASFRGGGIASNDSADYRSNPILRNTIVFGNTSPLGPDLSSYYGPDSGGLLPDRQRRPGDADHPDRPGHLWSEPAAGAASEQRRRDQDPAPGGHEPGYQQGLGVRPDHRPARRAAAARLPGCLQRGRRRRLGHRRAGGRVELL